MSTTAAMIAEPIVEPSNKTSIVKPYVMSHGTLECHSLKESRKFYEEFLGLECVRHAKPAMANHWGIDVRSKEEVDTAYQAALEHKDKYKIRQVLKPVSQHGVYSFYIEDLDHNWWEIQHYSTFQHDDLFDFGDRFDMEDGADLKELKELDIKNA